MRLIRLPEVQRKTSLSRSSLYRKIATGEFPAPYNIGNPSPAPRKNPERPGRIAVAWLESEVDDWILATVAARDATSKAA
jgi:prophage regulatory protein